MSDQQSHDSSSTPAQLRHSLRTPLNHIIGYSEMMVEELEDRQDALYEPTLIELRAIIFNARELVRFVSNALPAGKAEIVGRELKDLQFWLHSHVVQLLENTGSLAAEAPPEFGADVDRIRSAAERLLAFAQGETEALDQGPQPAPEQHSVAGAKGNILVVDDNAINRDILRRNLERDGYKVLLAGDGASALEALRQDRFALVLLDVVMPGTDGFEMLQQMKSAPETAQTPVIMISALDESSSVIRCIELGAEDYFMKPFDPVLLRTRIGATLERKRLEDQGHRCSAVLDELKGRIQNIDGAAQSLQNLTEAVTSQLGEARGPETAPALTNLAQTSRELLDQVRAAAAALSS